MKTLLSLSGALAFALTAWTPAPAAAQAECNSGLCGTPDQSGGGGGCGCGCGCGCSILVAMTDRGDTYQFADDFDGDGIEDEFDNCPFTANFEQIDADGDSVGDNCDVCAATVNPDQANLDGDAFGDACDLDLDGDLVENDNDNCPLTPNYGQLDYDADANGDVCDDDDDNDGLLDIDDDCRLGTVGTGADCEDDIDGDGVVGGTDNCPGIYNPPDGEGQLDTDADGLGDFCDADIDGDLIGNSVDNCPSVPNPAQIDADRDGRGDGNNFEAGAPETCDPLECYVVSGFDPGSSCLDPNRSFDVQLALVLENVGDEILVGDDVTIAIFSNRLDNAHNWTAAFTETPRSNRSALLNAEGSASTLNGFPQVASCVEMSSDGSQCERLNQISFTPSAAGTYSVDVMVQLAAGDDPQGLGPSAALASITAEVGGASAAGCAAGAPAGGLTLLAMGLWGLIRRRRA